MNTLPPMPPNMGPSNYPLCATITDVLDAVKRWENGERPAADADARITKRIERFLQRKEGRKP